MSIVDTTGDPTGYEIGDDCRLFTIQRSGAWFHPPSETTFHPTHMCEKHKVAWVDVPESLRWFFGIHWAGITRLTPRLIAEHIVENEMELDRVKAAFNFFIQYRQHSFTHYESNGLTRYRMAKKPLEMVTLSWDKRGIASVIQDNECYLHERLDNGGLSKVEAKVFSMLPDIRMRTLVQADTNKLVQLDLNNNQITNALSKIEMTISRSHHPDLKKVIKAAIDDAFSIKFDNLWLSHVLLGKHPDSQWAEHTLYAYHVLETEEQHSITDEFKAWLATHHAQGMVDFTMPENDIKASKMLTQCKASMAECIIALARLKQMHLDTYALYGIAHPNTSEDDEHE